MLVTEKEMAPGELKSSNHSAAEYFEYTRAANPVGSGLIPKVPFGEFPSRLHETGPTGIVPFDLSRELDTPYPATSPALLASYVRILPNECVATAPNASSELYYCLKGRGHTLVRGERLEWKTGDFMTLPALHPAAHHSDEESVFYWVHDEPLFAYLGAKPATARFEPTIFPAERCRAELEKVQVDPEAAKRNRLSILLANRRFPHTRTVSQTLWVMYGILPAGAVQSAHRHQSVALDFILECPKGCYSLIGTEIDENGKIVNPRRQEWRPGAAFVTPPGLWHSHHNESGEPAYLIPIQDAGLQTYLRSLDIRFTK